MTTLSAVCTLKLKQEKNERRKQKPRMSSLSKLSFAIELTQSSRARQQDQPDFDGGKVFVALLIDAAKKKKSHQLYSYRSFISGQRIVYTDGIIFVRWNFISFVWIGFGQLDQH